MSRTLLGPSRSFHSGFSLKPSTQPCCTPCKVSDARRCLTLNETRRNSERRGERKDKQGKQDKNEADSITIPWKIVKLSGLNFFGQKISCWMKKRFSNVEFMITYESSIMYHDNPWKSIYNHDTSRAWPVGAPTKALEKPRTVKTTMHRDAREPRPRNANIWLRKIFGGKKRLASKRIGNPRLTDFATFWAKRFYRPNHVEEFYSLLFLNNKEFSPKKPRFVSRLGWRPVSLRSRAAVSDASAMWGALKSSEDITCVTHCANIKTMQCAKDW